MPTQHQLLESISKAQIENSIRQELIDKRQKKTAEDLGNLSGVLSAYINNQNDRNVESDARFTKILGYLENNKDTGQDGVVKQIIELTKKVVGIEKKLAIFSVGAAGLIYGLKFFITKIIF